MRSIWTLDKDPGCGIPRGGARVLDDGREARELTRAHALQRGVPRLLLETLRAAGRVGLATTSASAHRYEKGRIVAGATLSFWQKVTAMTARLLYKPVSNDSQ